MSRPAPSSRNGVGRIDIRVQGEANWPTKLDTTISQTYSDAIRATSRSRRRRAFRSTRRSAAAITITATARGRRTASPARRTPVVGVRPQREHRAAARHADRAAEERVLADSVTGQRDGRGHHAARRHHPRQHRQHRADGHAPAAAAVQRERAGQRRRSTFRRTLQGQRLGDHRVRGRSGGSRRLRGADRRARRPRANLANALVDSTLLVYGRTYPLPQQGVIGDITVDAARGNVFVSNTNVQPARRLAELSTARASRPTPIAGRLVAVGYVHVEQPGHAARRQLGRYEHQPRLHRHDGRRWHARGSRAPHPDAQHLRLHDQRDARREHRQDPLAAPGPISYSDRPQYIAQAKGGRIFYSTRPTPTAPAGTHSLARSDRCPVPDPQPDLAVRHRPTKLHGTDYVAVQRGLDRHRSRRCRRQPTSDTLFDLGPSVRSANGTVVVADTDSAERRRRARRRRQRRRSWCSASTSLRLRLTDTTFVAAAGNRKWIAFGEGPLVRRGTHRHGRGQRRARCRTSSRRSSPSGPHGQRVGTGMFGLALDLERSDGGVARLAVVLRLGQRSVPPALARQVRLVRRRRRHRLPSDRERRVDVPRISGSPSSARRAATSRSWTSPTTSSAAPAAEEHRSTGRSARRCRCRANPGDVILKVFAVSPQGLVVIDLTANDIKPGPTVKPKSETGRASRGRAVTRGVGRLRFTHDLTLHNRRRIARAGPREHSGRNAGGVPLLSADVDVELARRQQGYGRGRRMQIEKDAVEFLSGVRAGETIGSPIAMLIRNRDWKNWQEIMDPARRVTTRAPGAPRKRAVTRVRPGHADLTGLLKYDRDDARDILERASARETTARVAAAAHLQAIPHASSACASGATSCTSAASMRARPDEMPDDINAAADESPLRTLDPDAEKRDDREDRRDQARGKHARRHLRGRRRRTARSDSARTSRGIASSTDASVRRSCRFPP